MDCASQHKTDPLLLKTCTGRCGEKLPEACFSKQMWTRVALAKIKCRECCKQMKTSDMVEEKECQACRQVLPRALFTDGEWRGGHGTHKCRNCLTGPTARRDQWTCVRCKDTHSIEYFQAWMTDKKTKKSKHCVCNACWHQEQVEKVMLQASNMEHVSKAADRR